MKNDDPYIKELKDQIKEIDWQLTGLLKDDKNQTKYEQLMAKKGLLKQKLIGLYVKIAEEKLRKKEL